MTTPEFWQIGASVGQALFGGLAIVGAWVIGRRQVAISKTQADIAKRQTELQESLVFGVAVEIVYNESARHIEVRNKGQTAITIWGTQLWDNEPTMESEPRYIAPGGFYFLILHPATVAAMEDPMPGGGTCEGRYRFFFKDLLDRKHCAMISLRRDRVHGQTVTRTQTLAMGLAEW